MTRIPTDREHRRNINAIVTRAARNAATLNADFTESERAEYQTRLAATDGGNDE